MSVADQGEKLAKLVYWLHTKRQKYGFALAAVAGAILVQYALDASLVFSSPFILFYPTIILVALIGGFGPGVFATVLYGAVAEYFFVQPLNSLAIRNPQGIVRLALFGLVGIAISGLGDLFRGSTKRLRAFEAAVEGLEEMITVVDRDYRYVSANRAFLTYRGMKKEDLLGRRVPDVLNPEVFESTVKGKLDECFKGNVVQTSCDPSTARGATETF